MCDALDLGRDGVGALEAEDVDAEEHRHGVAASVVYWEPYDQEYGKPSQMVDIFEKG